MATKKSNKTEHVLKLITKNQEDGAELLEDADQADSVEETEWDVAEVEGENAVEQGESVEEDSQEEAMQLDALEEQEPEVQVEAVTEAQKVSVAVQQSNINLVGESRLVNLAEELARELAPEVMKRLNLCQCPSCVNDVLALALNALPQKYVTTERGRQYTKLLNYRNQYETDVVAALTRASVRIKASPRHGSE